MLKNGLQWVNSTFWVSHVVSAIDMHASFYVQDYASPKTYFCIGFFFFFFISRELFFITMSEEVRSRANGSGKKIINCSSASHVSVCIITWMSRGLQTAKKKKNISAMSQQSERVRSRCANSRSSPNVPHHHGTKLRAQERWNVLRQLGGGL